MAHNDINLQMDFDFIDPVPLIQTNKCNFVAVEAYSHVIGSCGSDRVAVTLTNQVLFAYAYAYAGPPGFRENQIKPERHTLVKT